MPWVMGICCQSFHPHHYFFHLTNIHIKKRALMHGEKQATWPAYKPSIRRGPNEDTGPESAFRGKSTSTWLPSSVISPIIICTTLKFIWWAYSHNWTHSAATLVPTGSSASRLSKSYASRLSWIWSAGSCIGCIQVCCLSSSSHWNRSVDEWRTGYDLWLQECVGSIF